MTHQVAKIWRHISGIDIACNNLHVNASVVDHVRMSVCVCVFCVCVCVLKLTDCVVVHVRVVSVCVCLLKSIRQTQMFVKTTLKVPVWYSDSVTDGRADG